jgi:hypothetical protein
LDIENHTTGERVNQVFHDLLLTWVTVGDNVSAVTVKGSMTSAPSVFTDCFGGADFETLQALRIDPTGQIPCPTAGLVQVTLPGSVSRIQYTPNGGVQVDLNADGQPDRFFDRCNSPDIVLCRGPAVGVP